MDKVSNMEHSDNNNMTLKLKCILTMHRTLHVNRMLCNVKFDKVLKSKAHIVMNVCLLGDLEASQLLSIMKSIRT